MPLPEDHLEDNVTAAHSSLIHSILPGKQQKNRQQLFFYNYSLKKEFLSDQSDKGILFFCTFFPKDAIFHTYLLNYCFNQTCSVPFS